LIAHGSHERAVPFLPQPTSAGNATLKEAATNVRLRR
jgi:hypothetical protein